MDITGKVVKIDETQKVSERFRKRTVVVEYSTNPEYPEYVTFEFQQDRVDLLDQIAVGQEVQVWFDLRGRKWTAPDGTVKYFNTIVGWRIKPAGDVQPAPIEQSVAEEVPF